MDPTKSSSPVISNPKPVIVPHRSPESVIPDSPDTSIDHTKCYNTLVFGSSLTKGLNENLLSRGNTKFKVLSNPGARVKDIMYDILDTADNGTYCRMCVRSIFLVCGGNNIENTHYKEASSDILTSYTDLLDIISDVYPAAMVNVISLIPRRQRYFLHLQQMLDFNDKLSILCDKRSGCKFINIFSYFLIDKNNFFAHKTFRLNNKLYSRDMLHFSATGNSVLAKVIMGVTYKPYK